MKRTRLLRAVPLARTPWPRTPGRPPERRVPLRRGPDTGPDEQTRRIVLERDGWQCVCCGRSVIGQRYSLQHRKRRNQGGTNAASNLVTVLGWGGESCHGRIDLYKDPADGVPGKGYRVPSTMDPSQVPVVLFSGAVVLLDDAGGYTPVSPGEAGAA